MHFLMVESLFLIFNHSLGFYSLMEAYRIHLRVGGEKGIVRVKSKIKTESDGDREEESAEI